MINVALPLLFKNYRQEDGPAGERTLCRGLRAHMLRELSVSGYDRLTAKDLLEWAAALTAHNLLLRGGELGHSNKRGHDPN